MDVLIICIGNKARGDDGAARLVAELVTGLVPASATVLSAPQLDVVMAEDVAEASRVIFVDAERRDAPPVHVADLEPTVANSHAHGVDPGGLLSLAHTLYDAEPHAVLVSIAAPEMDHGEGLSETARAASVEAARKVVDLAHSLL